MTTAFEGVLPQTREQFERVRSRLDKVLLRAQGRMDHPNVDRFTPWAVSLVLFGVLLTLALAKSRSVDMGTDLASWVQASWLLGEGFKPEVTLLGPAGEAGQVNILAEQVALVVYPLSLLLRIFSSWRIETLLIIQSLALALTVVPLWRLARGLGRLRVGVTSAVAFAFCVYAAVHNVNLAGFHPAALALPALVAAARYGLEGHRSRYMLSVGFVLLCRADLGLAVAALGILLLVEGKRRWGLATLLTGLAWIVLAIFVLQPRLANDMWPHVGAFAVFGDTPFDILWGIVSNPVDFLREVFSRANFSTVVSLLAPVLFLPLVAPRYLLPVVPLYSLYLAADVAVGDLSESPQTMPITAFIFVATIFALQRSGQVLVERVSVDRRVVIALFLTASVFFIRDAASSPYEKPWNWSELTATDEAILEATDRIPDGALVRASPRALPMLAERVGVYELVTDSPVAEDEPFETYVDGVDWIIFDPEAAAWSEDVTGSGNFRVRLSQLGFVRQELAEAEGSGVMLFCYSNAEAQVEGCEG